MMMVNADTPPMRLVVALGGNAMLRRGDDGSIGKQLERSDEAMAHIARLVGEGHQIALTHGNGPVVGNIVLRNEAARDQVTPMPLYISGADSEGGLGFSTQAVGFLQGIVYAVTYVVPILGGALADRYGYRRMLLVAFSLLAAGYFAAGQVSTYGLVFLALLVMATGSGTFKPIISGTIARTTDERTSAFGFGIYYWTINLGAFISRLE